MKMRKAQVLFDVFVIKANGLLLGIIRDFLLKNSSSGKNE